MAGPSCLVIGASGFMGTGAVDEIAAGYDVIPTSNRDRGGPYRRLDARDPEALARAVRDLNPDCVAMLAAYRNPDDCESDPEETRRLNTEPMNTLVKVLSPEAQLLFVSTDYVFDGDNPPYEVDAERNPVNVYGQSKKEAEDIVLARPKSSVLRVPLLMGWTDQPEQSGFFSQLINDLKHGDELPLDDVLARYPVWTRDAGRAIRIIFEEGHEGAFHFSTTERLTRYTAAVGMGELLGWPTDHLIPSKDVIPRPARRPRDARLSVARWTSLGHDLPASFREVAGRFIEHFGIR